MRSGRGRPAARERGLTAPARLWGPGFGSNFLKKVVDPEFSSGIVIPAPTHGELAQLGERVTGSHEVRGSNPLFSTIHSGRRRLPSPFFLTGSWRNG